MPTCLLGCGPIVIGTERLRDNRFGLEREIRVGWCGVCGLGKTIDPLSQDELDALYEGCYGEGAERPQVPRDSSAARIWRRVNGSSPLADEGLQGPAARCRLQPRRALLVLLRDRGLEVVGLEPNPVAAAAARAHGLRVLEQPIEDAGLPPGGYASILLSQVLEHVRDPHAVLRSLRPALRDDGRLYVVVPNVASVWRHVFGADWVHWHVPFHLWHHTRRSLQLLLEQSGYELERSRSFTPGEWLLMSLEARRNARRDVYRLEPFRGHFARRLALAPLGRLGDAAGRGDALYGVARAA